LALVGIRQSGVLDDEDPLNNAAVGAKLVIALAIAVIAWRQRGNRESAPAGAIHSVGGLALVNLLIGVFWIG
jgi:hypothetical protein